MSKPRRRRRKARLPEELVEADITALSAEGRGIAHVDGRTVFVDQALPGERVKFQYTRITEKLAEARTTEIVSGASADRVSPQCAVFELCGGCSLQHMSAQAQITLKQNTLLELLQHVGKVKPQEILAPLTGPQWRYRHKARLGVRYVPKKQKVLVGFRERNSSFITDTKRCEILHASVGDLLEPLAQCIHGMALREQIPQIEVAIGDAQTVLVFRHLADMTGADRDILSAFCQQHNLVAWLQPGKPDALEPLWPEAPETLFYELPEFGVRIEFEPADFTQINTEINRSMLHRVIELLQPEPENHVLDLFCGLGNFSLPLAKHCQQVTAVEGSGEMVRKARANADRNHIDNIEFIHANLYDEALFAAPWMQKKYQRILLDPPRSGALEILPHLKKMQASRIVYVSCHPATLARDAGVLVNELGYECVAAGVMDMFPHTAHVESIAVFLKQ
ncbi:MAG: 23S rRNA (uracil(1939)-C(5))-methyltransferase RlmD [Gammaproteobacteria bacterium]